jgi:hypothetical protein
MVSKYRIPAPPVFMLYFWLGFAVLFIAGGLLFVLLLLPLKLVSIGLAFIASCYAVGRTIMEGYRW